MFTVRITEVEAHENGQYSNVIREYTHRSPKVAYARATEWGWWKWCSVKKTGYPHMGEHLSPDKWCSKIMDESHLLNGNSRGERGLQTRFFLSQLLP